MNRYAQAVINEFASPQNRYLLYSRLIGMFKADPAVVTYLDNQLDVAMTNHRTIIFREMTLSDPTPGATPRDQLACFNSNFIAYIADMISAYVIADTVPMYSVSDGRPTSRNGAAHYAQPAANVLKSWEHNAGRSIQFREDPGAAAGHYESTQGGSASAGVTSGITFCNMSHLGTSNHIDQYENTFYKKHLNAPGYTTTAFGVSTPAADARLMSRRIFRNNETGTENGIPRYETRLYNRNLDRNIDEGLRATEMDYQQRGFDMSTLRGRTDLHAAARIQHGGVRPMTRPYNHGGY